MTIAAVIQFTQGPNTAAPGTAVIGTMTDGAVTCASTANTGVHAYSWTMIDVPEGSAIPLGVFSASQVTTFPQPDLRGGYLVQLVTSDEVGGSASALLSFQVLEASGRLIPSFKASDLATNFGGQKRGWAKYLTEWLKHLDVLGAVPIVLHDTTFSPVALWQLQNQSFVDMSGSGITLVQDTVKAWTEIWPGLGGWDMIGGARLDSVAPSPAALALTGDMTISAFVKIPDRSRLGGAQLCLAAYEANTGAASGNALWHVGMNNNQLRFLSQHGSQVLDQYLVPDQLVPEGLLLLDMTRTAGVPQFYVNGLPFGATGSALTTPTGGSSSTLTFGGLSSSTSGSPLQAGLASVAIYGTALSAAQIKAKYNRCFGPVFGVRP